MTMTEERSTAAVKVPPQAVDMKLEIVVIPVSDVERAKAFYASLGWRLDADFASADGWRVIQFTPPGSSASVIFGKNVTTAAPGSAQGLYLIVSDIEAARADLVRRGIEVGEVFHGASDMHAGTDEPYLFGRLRRGGVDPQHGSYQSFASFRDPDGNGWLLQEITARLPGRVEGETIFTSSIDLATALRRAAAAHGEHEKRSGGQHDANWPDWYAEYMVGEQAGKVPHKPHFKHSGEVRMSMIVVKAIRAMTATTLIVGSIYVQHVARAQQVGSKQVELRRGNSPGSELAMYIIESSKPLLTLVR